MAQTAFKTNPVALEELSDFPRSWFWDEDRIKAPLASVAFPASIRASIMPLGYRRCERLVWTASLA